MQWNSQPRSESPERGNTRRGAAAIDELPESYRKVLRLRYIEERSTAATAVLLKMTENNVKSRVRHARRALLCRLRASRPL